MRWSFVLNCFDPPFLRLRASLNGTAETERLEQGSTSLWPSACWPGTEKNTPFPRSPQSLLTSHRLCDPRHLDGVHAGLCFPIKQTCSRDRFPQSL
ncbi:hypothetical protein B0H34DRAFT_715678 [Crassisporium funariophilum]|nr:hypothetical protein B0H34DRAFT_715678 [Crassisporium funariophilum]